MSTEPANIMVETGYSATMPSMSASLSFPQLSSGRQDLEPLTLSLRLGSWLPWRTLASIRNTTALVRAMTKRSAQDTENLRKWSRALESIPEDAAYHIAMYADDVDADGVALRSLATDALKLARQPLPWLFGPSRELADALAELRIAKAKLSATLRAMLDRYDGSEHEAGLSEAARERLDKALRTPRSGRVMSFTQYADDA